MEVSHNKKQRKDVGSGAPLTTLPRPSTSVSAPVADATIDIMMTRPITPAITACSTTKSL